MNNLLKSNASNFKPLFTVFLHFIGLAQTIWNSNTITFNKVALEDADPITQHVILTRGENKGIYNSALETVCTSISPMDTEWAEGTTANWSNLVFESFSNGIGLGNNG